MKKLKIANTVLVASAVLMILFILLGSATAGKVYTYLGVAAAIAGLAVYLILGRCPHCGKYLGMRGSDKFCPHCGKELKD